MKYSKGFSNVLLQNSTNFSCVGIPIFKQGADGFGGFSHTKLFPSNVVEPEIFAGNSRFALRNT